jgi:hypothetical protein
MRDKVQRKYELRYSTSQSFIKIGAFVDHASAAVLEVPGSSTMAKQDEKSPPWL